MKGDAIIKEIQGLHHVTSMASDAAITNTFFTKILGLRRVKKTVNFDALEVYPFTMVTRLGRLVQS